MLKSYYKKEYVDIVIIYSLSVAIIIFLSCIEFIVTREIKKNNVVTSQNQQPPVALFDTKAFASVEVQAKAYIVYDLLNHQIIASKNESTKLPLASITKVMTAVSSVLHASKDTVIPITPSSIEDGYDLGLLKNQSWKLSELLKYTLLFSSNDASEAIANSFGGKETFLTYMNNDASNLGLSLYFTDPAGRDLNGKIGGEGTALDVAKLFGVARQTMPEIFDATTKKRQTMIASSGRVSGIPNTNQEIQEISGAEASKTGYTDLAGGNLGVIVDITIGHPVVIVVLGSTREGRFNDVAILYNALQASVKNYPVSPLWVSSTTQMSN